MGWGGVDFPRVDLVCTTCAAGQAARRAWLLNLGKIGSICLGVCRVIFDENIKNEDFQEVGTTSPIEKALVN